MWSLQASARRTAEQAVGDGHGPTLTRFCSHANAPVSQGAMAVYHLAPTLSCPLPDRVSARTLASRTVRSRA